MGGASEETERFEASLFALLEATEALWASLADGASPDVQVERLARRERAFAEVEQASSAARGGRPVPGAGARACLDRIAELDAAILQAGRAELDRLQRERLALGGRRRAVTAHGLQPRETPRVVTIKA